MGKINRLLIRPGVILILIMFAGLVQAQERFVLVIDGSGSMWGQVEGEAKISMLRRNLGDLLGELQTDAEVGLVAFGHREKGNCADIEEIVPPGPFDPEILGAAIAGIQPKGMTPLSEAVRLAADSLRFTEEKATVVILGDGRESCGMDPCSTAEELERTGVDFTVHAIAFDLADEEGTRQLQCFARETGGVFFEAANSVELVAALEEVRQEVAPESLPEPEPEPEQEPAAAAPAVLLTARDALTGAEIAGVLDWTFINTQNERLVAFSAESGTESGALAPGEYDVIVQADEGFGEGRAIVADDGPSEIVVEVVAAVPAGLVLGRESLPAGAVLAVEWTFQGQPDDMLFIAPLDQSDNRYPTDEVRRHLVGAGEIARLVVPAVGGTYEVRYFSPSAGGVLHRASFRVTPSEVSLQGPKEALAGSSIEVYWAGPAAPGDMIFVAPADWANDVYPSRSSDRAEASGISPLRVPVPGSVGRHELRYFSWANGAALAAVALDVKLRPARVSAPLSVPAGSVVPVDFEGPRLDGDTLFFITAGADESRYYRQSSHETHASGASPARIIAPAEPGAYEVRYFSPENGGLLARFAVEVVAPEVQLDAPRLVQRGETFELRATGPSAPGDIVFVIESASPDNRYPGNSSQRHVVGPDGGGFFDDDGFYVFDVVAPAQPGGYEVRYFSWENAATLDRRALIVR